MTTRRTLSSADREFFSLVSQAVFANPFSDERDRLFAEIAHFPGEGSDDEWRQQVGATVSRRLESLAANGARVCHIGDFGERDREVLEIACLFDTYHRYLAQLDALILEQIQAGDEPCKVDFATSALDELTARGFSRSEAQQYLAMFYQLRRAYYFINRQLVGRSPCMKELRRHLWNNVVTHNVRWYAHYLVRRMEDFSTLLLGETGTGKGTAASAIGRSGFIPFDEKKNRFVESFTKAFVSINLSQFPEMLIESELFGHRKGAFTGACEDHDGIFSQCSPHGAILLDEIGEVAVPVQIKLLHVLQEREFSPVGSHERCRFEGRVVAATNRPLSELRDGAFRDDFFYRLSSDVIAIPPLRQRLSECSEELDELLAHVMSRMTGDSTDLVDPIRERIKKVLPSNYDWPGNVRELEQCVRRILLTNEYSIADRAGPTTQSEALFRTIETGELNAQSY